MPAWKLFNLPSCLATLQKADPLKVYPQLKGSLPENLKHLKDTMDGLDWKVSSFPCTSTLPPCLQQPWDEGREQGSRS